MQSSCFCPWDKFPQAGYGAARGARSDYRGGNLRAHRDGETVADHCGCDKPRAAGQIVRLEREDHGGRFGSLLRSSGGVDRAGG